MAQVALIKEAIISAPGTHAPTGGGASGVGTGGVVSGGYGSSPAIEAMQRAIQDLAKDVTSQINLQDVSSGDPKREQEAKERDAFGVFLTKNYMRNTKVPGVEFDPNPKITDVSQKSPDDPTRMSVVMDTMNRVGNPQNPQKGETFADGKWGPRTNAAVRDVFAFASGLFDFLNDINRFATKKLDVSQTYSTGALSELEQYAKVDPNALTPAQKVAAAPKVTEHVKAIQKMYDQVKRHILEHPNYQRFIEGRDSFKSYYKVTPQQISLLKKNFPQGIDVAFKNFQSRIPIDSLTNLESLKAWMQRAAPDAVQRGELTPETVVSAVWKAQSKLLGEDPGY